MGEREKITIKTKVILKIIIFQRIDTIMNNDMAMFSFHARIETFSQWPHTDCNCTPEKLADAGWFMIGSSTEPDQTRCYYCQRELDGWEPEDDPWEEHLRRSGDPCPFIKKGKKARELTVKDGLELEAETVKQLMVEMGNKAQKNGPKKAKT